MSLAVIIGAPGKIVLATDSRGMVLGPGIVSVEGDHYQKLFQCGDRTAIVLVGWLGRTGGFSVSDQMAAICQRTHLQDRPDEILEAIRAEIGSEMSEIPTEYRVADSPLIFAAIALRMANDGALDFLELRYSSPEDWSPPVMRHIEAVRLDRNFHFCTGWATDVTHELAAQLTPNACDDPALIQRVSEIFEATQKTEHGNEIGGPIDIACLDANGFCWVQKKLPGHQSAAASSWNAVAPQLPGAMTTGHSRRAASIAAFARNIWLRLSSSCTPYS